MKNHEILLIFDLDFTLIDNSEGIINSFNYALRNHGHQTLSSEEIISLIGVPLELMFSKYVDMDVNILVKTFREYYFKKGILELTLLPGAKEKIIDLYNLGYKLSVLTSKKEQLARVLVKNLELEKYFELILGSTEDRKLKNSPLLKKLLQNKFRDITKYCMIGDHINDGKVSELLNCPFIGLLTGKTTKKELVNSSKMKKKILNTIIELNPEIINSLFK